MHVPPPPARIAVGQSRDDTRPLSTKAGMKSQSSVFMVNMMFAFVMVLALLHQSTRAESAAPRVTAVATTRAQIMAGVRISGEQSDRNDDVPSRLTRLPKPRERPCPDTDAQPCRLIVVDMP